MAPPKAEAIKPINLDLLKKLTKLANNNPNEHEANSAARRVCKLLEEGNWKLDSTVTVPPPNPPTPKATTWNDVTRSQEPMWASNPTYDPNDIFREFFRSKKGPVNYENEREKARTRKPEPGFGDDPVSPFADPDWTVDPNFDFAKKNRKAKQDAERAEWIFDPFKNIYFNARTGEKITELDYRNRFGIR